MKCTENKTKSIGNFNMENVNSLLSKSIPLSKNAQSFKLLFENSQRTPMFPQGGAGVGPPNFADLLNNPAMLGLASATLLAGKKPANPPVIPPVIPQENSKNSSDISVNLSEPSNKEINQLAELKLYIDSKFVLLENSLLARLKESEQNTNAKLDLILAELEKNS